MRKFIAITTAVLLSVISANAQYKMKVTLNDGRISDFFVSEIKDISWEEFKPEGEGNDENEPTVTGDATDVTNYTATITAWANNILDNLSTDLEVGIIYTAEGTPSKSNGKKQIVNTSDIASDGEYSVKLTRLSPSTTYSYRSYVYQSGLYFYGMVKSFTTKGQGTNLVTGEASSITCYSAKIAASVNIDSNTSYKSLKYGVCYGTTSELSVSDSKVEGTSRNADGSFSVTFRALSGSTIYYYRTYACVDGFYEYGEVRSFQTIADNVVETGEYDEETGTVTSKLTLGGGAYSKLEVGLCWSRTSEEPTINNNTKITNELDDENRYVISPTFESGTYYYRAYVLIDEVAHYGKIKKVNKAHVTEIECVDLGLSVKWATCNVGASFPEDYGDYYAWGETETKSTYDQSTYKWCSNGSCTKYCTDRDYGKVDNKTVLDPEDDVAHVKWGGSWRMPTAEEIKELERNCIWTWTTQDGTRGYKVTSWLNGNSIFLPATGFRGGNSLYDAGSRGGYWSSSLYDSDGYYASYLYFDSYFVYWDFIDRNGGQSVRPVWP